MDPPFFTCGKCGKVCKSARGLNQHSAIHCRPTQLANPIQGFCREYHPLLNGNHHFPTHLILRSQILKGRPAITMAIFFHQSRHQHHHRRSRTTTGRHSHRGQDLSLLRSSTSRPISLKVLSTNFSTSGVPRLSPTAISPPSLIIKNSMHRSTQSDWETSHGNHTLPSISGSVLRMVQYQSG